MSYDKVMALPKEKRHKPCRPMWIFRWLLKFVSAGELKKTRCSFNAIGMEKLNRNEPALFLMNHSSFIDLKMAVTYLYPRPFNIICTSDGFVGKNLLMRLIGCIPAKKFVTDFALVKDMLYAVKNLKNSILMYPEASYSFDGTATPIPDSLGKMLKKLDIPVVMITTHGAFAHDPLYNGLRLRDVTVSADIEYLFSRDDIKEKSEEEINAVLCEKFSFDNFKWQKENGIKITEPFRAEGLERVLYKCPVCGDESSMKSEGIHLKCEKCGKSWTLDEYGQLEGDGGFSHIPDWYNWEREAVRAEIDRGEYLLNIPVDICMMVDTKAIYSVGEGTLTHGVEGFHLTGCNGRLEYSQKPQASYSLYADYFWYEIGDIICIGTGDVLYYCFPKGMNVAAKCRIASEELYKRYKNRNS